MTVKTILVPLSGDAQDRRNLDLAADLARRTGAHIEALYTEADPRDLSLAFVSDGMGSFLSEDLLQVVRDQQDARGRAAAKTFSDWQAVANIPVAAKPPAGASATAKFHRQRGDQLLPLRDHALLADLVVAGLPEPGAVDRSELIEAALFGAGCPVLGVPRSGPAEIPKGIPVVIAWTDRIEAARALRASLPWMLTASETIVLHVGPDNPVTLNHVAEHLGWYGVKARTVSISDAHTDTARAILDQLGKLGAGLLVMGGYSHSRARELVFGGVTRYVLGHAPIPVLLAH
jgi:nucleotide-binding universal stress UspA family protein